ncbi:MAG: HAMP domain-containing protein [Thermoflexales bacterium]|nr:HAMP domain-containing protein [Thermoflexales bacterium]
MNRLWVRISLTFIAIFIFVIMIPMIVGVSTRSFNVNGNIQGTEQAGEEQMRHFPPIPGTVLLGGLLRIVIAVTVIGIAVGVISSRGLTAPLNKLAETAQAIGARDLSRRVEVKGSDEVQAVARAFNEMANKLEKAEALRSNMLADVAHELRTPLSVIQGNLRAILDDVYELDKAEIARLYDQTRHLSRLVDDLHELSLAEANQLPLAMTAVDLSAIIQETVATYTPIIEAEGLVAQIVLDDGVPTIQADRARLTQCLQNLLNNAIRHTPKGGEITIELAREANQVCLRVRDSGHGIAPEHLSYVFDRFYRADPARSRENGGSGLGLAIVKAIVEAHGGQVTAASQGDGQGSTFTIQLPI